MIPAQIFEPASWREVREQGASPGPVLAAQESSSPIVAYVGRLDEQKGMQLVHHALFYALSRGAQFVLLGEPVHENGISSHFRHLKHHLNENPDCHLEISYSEELAHLIYAGADMLVVPSMYEPCGLAPMVALRYGTVPVVRSVGGMVDTVFDRDYSPRPREERNGYTSSTPTTWRSSPRSSARCACGWIIRPGSGG